MLGCYEKNQKGNGCISTNLWRNHKDGSHKACCYMSLLPALRKKATIHQVTTMLDASKNVIFPGHNHLLTTSTDDLAL